MRRSGPDDTQAATALPPPDAMLFARAFLAATFARLCRALYARAGSGMTATGGPGGSR
jgi:hypothetical protein